MRVAAESHKLSASLLGEPVEEPISGLPLVYRVS